MTTEAFNRLFDYHKKLSNIYDLGYQDGYFNGYFGNIHNSTVKPKVYSNPVLQSEYTRGYNKGFSIGEYEV